MYSPPSSPTKQPRSSLSVQLMPRRRRFFLQILLIVQFLLSIASLVLSSINLHIGLSNDSMEELEDGLLPFAEGRGMTWNQWINSTTLVITAACILTVCYLVFTIRLFVNNSRRTYYAPSVFTSGLVLAVRSWSVATICLAFMVYDLAITLPALFGDLLLFYMLYKWSQSNPASPHFELSPVPPEGSKYTGAATTAGGVEAH